MLFGDRDVVAVGLEEGVASGFIEIVGDHVGAHFFGGDFGNPSCFSFDFTGEGDFDSGFAVREFDKFANGGLFAGMLCLGFPIVRY